MPHEPGASVGPDARLVFGRLAHHFPEPHKPRLEPLDELVLTILSQSTTDANRDRAWTSLAERFPRSGVDSGAAYDLFSRPGPICWDAVVDRDASELATTIRVAGLGNQKAKAILGVLSRLVDEVGRPSLDHIEDMADDEAIRYLTGFGGVGVKTAACVLCFSLRRPVLPVDTHVLRIARRLSWIPVSASADKAHGLLAGRVRPTDRFRMHMLLITLGRTICTARGPRCDECPLVPDCPRVLVEP